MKPHLASVGLLSLLLLLSPAVGQVPGDRPDPNSYFLENDLASVRLAYASFVPVFGGDLDGDGAPDLGSLATLVMSSRERDPNRVFASMNGDDPITHKRPGRTKRVFGGTTTVNVIDEQVEQILTLPPMDFSVAAQAEGFAVLRIFSRKGYSYYAARSTRSGGGFKGWNGTIKGNGLFRAIEPGLEQTIPMSSAESFKIRGIRDPKGTSRIQDDVDVFTATVSSRSASYLDAWVKDTLDGKGARVVEIPYGNLGTLEIDLELISVQAMPDGNLLVSLCKHRHRGHVTVLK